VPRSPPNPGRHIPFKTPRSVRARVKPKLDGDPPLHPHCQNSQLHEIAGPLVGNYLSHDPATTAPWAGILQQNTPGNAPITVPLFVAQGLADQLVHPAATEQFVRQQCTKGTQVTFKEVPGAGHGQIALDVVPDVLTFFAGARAGAPPASTC